MHVLQVDRSAIEAGLPLAHSKFGRTLELTGNDANQLVAATIAVDAGLRVQFTDARLNRAMEDYRHSRAEQHVRDVLGSSSPGALAKQLPQPQANRPEPDQPRPADDTKPTV